MPLKSKNFSLSSFLFGALAGALLVGAIGAIALMHMPGLNALPPGVNPHARPQATAAEDAAVNSVRAGIAALGKQWDAEVKTATATLYAPLHQGHDNSGIKQLVDQPYGSDPQQTADLFVPNQGFDELGPVLLFLHDDSFNGDKHVGSHEELFYGNVGRWLARAGGIGITANVRRTNAADTLSVANDLRLLIEWAQQNVAQYGGDPANIILLGVGDSAVAMTHYLFDASVQPVAGPGVVAGILSGGNYAVLPADLVESYQGRTIPLSLWKAEFDPMSDSITQLNTVLCGKYAECPGVELLAGHNAISPVMSIDSVDTTAGELLIRFYHRVVF